MKEMKVAFTVQGEDLSTEIKNCSSFDSVSILMCGIQNAVEHGIIPRPVMLAGLDMLVGTLQLGQP